MSVDIPKRFEFDLPINDVDALCLEALSSRQISMIYSFGRTTVSDNYFEYQTRINLDYMPDLGKITLSYIDQKTYLSFMEPDLPNLGDEALYKLHLKDLKEAGGEPPKEPTTIPLEKPDGEKIGDIKSWAHHNQMQAWNEFQIRFLEEFDELYRSSIPIDEPESPTEPGARSPKRGSPGLSEEKWIERLSLAQEAEEMRESSPDMTWMHISIKVGWEFGSTRASKVKSLEKARFKLKDLEIEDPDNLLEKIRKKREKKES